MACCSRKQLLPEAQQAEIVPRMLVMMQESVERFRLTIAQLTNLTRLQQAAPSRSTVSRAWAPRLASTFPPKPIYS